MSPFSFRSNLLLALIVMGAPCIYVFLGLNLIILLIALGLAGLLYVAVAKRYGWGNEGRLTRHLSRPPFEDERRTSN
jgi:hypothetical protein